MKRLSFSALTFILGSTLLAAPSFGGSDVKQAPTDSLQKKEIEKAPPEKEKGFEHKSKYQREQQEGMTTPQITPEKDKNMQKSADKEESPPVGFQE